MLSLSLTRQTPEPTICEQLSIAHDLLFFLNKAIVKKKIQFELNVFIKKDIFKYQEITRFFFLICAI